MKGGSVSVYLAGTSTPCRIWDANNVLHDTDPQLVTDYDGRVTLKLDDEDYFSSQLFDVVVTPNGVCQANEESIKLYSIILLDDTANNRYFAAEAGATAGAQLGVNLTNEAGVTILYNADVVTSLGTAAAIASQGALATEDAADWLTTLNNIPARYNTTVGAGTSSGLYITSSYMGYWNTTTDVWQAYIRSNGYFYFGDGSNRYISWDGSNLNISTSESVNILSGGDLTLIGDDSNPGKIIFDGSSQDVEFFVNSASSAFYMHPTSSSTVDLYIGRTYSAGSTYGFDTIYMYCGNDLQLRCEYPATSTRYAQLYANQTSGTSLDASMTAYYDGTHYAKIGVVAANTSTGYYITMEGPLYDGGNGFNACRIKTGTYTGDGTTSYPITGVGFTPKYVRIWAEVSSGTSTYVVETTDTLVAEATPLSGYHASDHTLSSDKIISLDSGGFTVDDAGADLHPNKSGQAYHYLALG